MEKIDFKLFEKGLEEAVEFSLESDLLRLGKGITIRTLECFDRLMLAKSTEELSDLTDEDIFEIASHSDDLVSLYKQQRFLTESTFSNLQNMRNAKKRRIL